MSGSRVRGTDSSETSGKAPADVTANRPGCEGASDPAAEQQAINLKVPGSSPGPSLGAATSSATEAHTPVFLIAAVTKFLQGFTEHEASRIGHGERRRALAFALNMARADSEPRRFHLASLDTQELVLRVYGSPEGGQPVLRITFADLGDLGLTARQAVDVLDMFAQRLNAALDGLGGDRIASESEDLQAKIDRLDRHRPAIIFTTQRTKPLAELTPNDVPRGLNPEDVATDFAPAERASEASSPAAEFARTGQTYDPHVAKAYQIIGFLGREEDPAEIDALARMLREHVERRMRDQSPPEAKDERLAAEERATIFDMGRAAERANPTPKRQCPETHDGVRCVFDEGHTTRHFGRRPNGDDDSWERTTSAKEPGQDVVCGDHWRGLSGEMVDGSTGCPWCHVAELQAEIDRLDRHRPPITFTTERTKPLAELTPLDVPRGLDPEDVATDFAPVERTEQALDSEKGKGR